MSDTIKLPGSSYTEIIKIIKAYGSCKEGQSATLDELVQRSSIDRTVISRNNGFLNSMGLISDGKSKSPTKVCIQLSRAYEYSMQDEVTKIWAQILTENEFLMRMLSAVKIRGGMDRESFASHILYSAGISNTKGSKTGANTIIDICLEAKL